MKQSEILQRSLELLYPGEDKQKLMDKLNKNDNYVSPSNQQKNDDFSTQPKSTKNVDYESVNTLTKSNKKLAEKSLAKKQPSLNRSLTPKYKTNTTNNFQLTKNKSSKGNLNKSVSLRENSKMRDSLNKSTITNHDNGKFKLKIVKTLETLISEIKHYGFNKTKQEINERLKVKQEIEANIEALQRRKTSLYMEGKMLSTNNSKIVNETHIFQNKGEVSKIR